MPAPRTGFVVLLASLVLNLLSLALPIVILQVYDRILPNQSTDTLLLLVLGLGIVFLLDGAFRMARAHITGWNAMRYEHGAGCRAVNRLLGSEVGGLERSPPGVHLDRMASIDTLRDFYAGQAKLLLVDLPFAALFYALIWVIAGPLVVVPLTLLLCLALPGLAVSRRLRQALEERGTLDDRRYSFIIEVLSGIQSVKALAMESLMQRRYERLQESGAASTYRITTLSHLAQSLGTLFASLTMVSVASAGAVMVMSNQLSLGGLAACTMLAGRSTQPLLRALGIWTQFQSIALAKQRLSELFALQPEVNDAQEPTPRLRGRVRFEDVGYRFADEEAWLFKDLNLAVEPGETIGIRGDTGSGKSTLLTLLMGALHPQQGRVMIDDVDLASCDPRSLRQQIGYLPQSAVLFHGTILENITMFRYDRDAINEALAAARLLGIEKTIHRLPEGFETHISDSASEGLPVGIKQGITMARALCGKPKLILFDEANSALDSANDAKLKEVFAGIKGKATVILISQRPSLLALADRQFELRDGRLVTHRDSKAKSRGSRPISSVSTLAAGDELNPRKAAS